MKKDDGSSFDAYMHTVERIEPNVSMLDRDGALASIAISMKRIADALEEANYVATQRWNFERENR